MTWPRETEYGDELTAQESQEPVIPHRVDVAYEGRKTRMPLRFLKARAAGRME